MKDYLLPGKVYDILKWLGLIALPALATLLGTAMPAMGAAAEVTNAATVCITALGTFIGALIGVSAAKAKGGADGED